MRLDGRNVNYVVILIPETEDLLGLGEVAGLVGRMPSPRHRGFTTMRTAVGNLRRSKETNGIPSWACTNSVPDQHSTYLGAHP